jgi:hypothetical protein
VSKRNFNIEFWKVLRGAGKKENTKNYKVETCSVSEKS